MRTLPLSLALVLLGAPLASAQAGGLGAPRLEEPSSAHVASDSSGDRFAGELLDLAVVEGLIQGVERRARPELEAQLLVSGALTAVGAAGVITGLVLMVASLECRESTGWISFGPTCAADSGLVHAGLVTAGISVAALITGAIWLSRADRYRRRLDRAARSADITLDAQLGPGGGAVQLRGVF